MAFPVVVHRCEIWTRKEAEHWSTDAFELCCLRRLLRVPWTARKSNQSILKEINPEYSLEGLKLKLQYFGHLMQRAGLLPQWLSGKDSACSTRTAGDMGSITGLDEPLEKGMATHSSILVGEPMNRGAWQVTVHGVTELDTNEATLHTRTMQNS